jgi:hypothetical protein|uniref:Uncharacterized protein n=1 Tax=uncultured marine virus TaxID=186617 RepID=A0A0F7L9L3_9VIRU|nr:hypothetical protein [uncultured marine virus]
MIKFHTNRINKRFVRNTIWNTLLNLKVNNIGRWIDKWDIHVWDLKDTNPQFFEHVKTTSGQKINTSMPSGVTGKFRMDLYLHDSSNVFKARENSDRIMHETCHAILIGTPHFVSGVHDNINNRFQATFWYWDRFKYTKFTLSIIDIRAYL